MDRVTVGTTRIHVIVRLTLTLVSAFALAGALAACRKSTMSAPDAGAAAPSRVPAPNSPLARELGTDDAGRGEYRLYDDGPWCGFAPRVDRDKALRPVGASSSPLSDSSALGFFETKTAPPDGPRLFERAALALSLTGPARGSTGQPLPLALSLVNGGAQPLHYGMPVDGSFEHWRGPFVDLYARDEALGRTYRWTFGKGFGRCGNMDPRRNDDFVLLPPGKRRVDPFGPRSHPVLSPIVTRAGRYTLWVVYASECAGVELSSGDGFDAKPPDDRFLGTIASNGVTVEIVAEP